MAKKNPDWQNIEPLGKITCSSHDCEHDLHCFQRRYPKGKSYRNNICYYCGVELIDWDRIDKKDLKDVDYTIQAIQYEMIRHYYWHKDIDDNALNDAYKNGLQQLRINAEKRIIKRVSPPSSEIYRDGTQTPFKGKLIYYAQHATATCCRKCIEEWYGIYRNRPLNQKEIMYMVDLIMLYIKKRVPKLS